MYNQKPLSGDLIDYGHPLSQGLAAFWPFNEDNNSDKVFDLSGNGLTGTFVNSPIWVPGPFGSSINFTEASNQYISMGDCLNNLIVPFTFVTNFKVVDTDVHGLIDTDNEGASGQFNGFYVYVSANDIVASYGDNSGGGASARRSTVTTDNSIANNTYYHLVIVCRGAQDWSIYIDGISHALTYSGTGNAMVHISASLTLGTISTAAVYHHDGDIDYGMFYNYALTYSEVELLYREPFCMVRTKRRRIIYDEIAGAPPGSFPYYYREIASRRIA